MAFSRTRLIRNYLVTFYGAYRLTRNQNDTKYLYYVTDSQDLIDQMYRDRKFLDDPFQGTEIETLWHKRYFPPSYDLDALQLLPKNTLGYVYSCHMKKYNLTPDFYLNFRNLNVEQAKQFFNSRTKYIRFRISQTHDVWHVLTGFDVSPIGEAGLQGFYFGQFHSGFSVLIYLISLIASLAARQYDSMEKSMELFYEGYLNGRKAQFLLPVKWEEHWAEDIDDVRRKYDIQPARYNVEEVIQLSRKRH